MPLTSIISISILVLVILLATVGPVNMGALAFVAAFVVGGLMAGEATRDVLGDFPADLFVMLVGVTYLFGIARRNGTVGWAIESTFRAVRGRAAALPWVFFGLSTLLCAVGGVSGAVAVILLPVGMAIASAHGVRPVVVAITIGMGATAGSFSPLGVLGITIAGIQEQAGLPFDPAVLFGATLVAGVLAAAAATVFVGRDRRAVTGLAPVSVSRVDGSAGASGSVSSGVPGSVSSGVPDGGSGGGVSGGSTGTAAGGDDATDPPARLDTERAITLGSFVVLVVGALLFGIDIGFLALALAVVLTFAYPASGRAAVGDVSWGVVLLLTGIVTYVGVLERNGTVAWAGEAVAAIRPTLVAALLICVIAAVVSAFASTVGMLAALVPMTAPLVLTGDVSAIGLVTALAISASIVDVSPFSTCGALAMANAPEHERPSVYRGLLVFAGAVAVLGPLVAWAVLVVTGWF